MDDPDTDREPKPAPRDISDAPMVGKPSDFDFPPLTDPSPEDIDAMLADAFPGLHAPTVLARILAATDGEASSADLPRGVR